MDKKLTKKQKMNLFLDIFLKHDCNVTETCAEMKIHRSEYVDWINNCKNFLEEVEYIRMIIIDKAEKNLVKKVQEGDIPVSKYWLEKRDPERWGTKGNNSDPDKPVAVHFVEKTINDKEDK